MTLDLEMTERWQKQTGFFKNKVEHSMNLKLKIAQTALGLDYC